jgi:hypothetical protein
MLYGPIVHKHVSNPEDERKLTKENKREELKRMRKITTKL